MLVLANSRTVEGKDVGLRSSKRCVVLLWAVVIALSLGACDRSNSGDAVPSVVDPVPTSDSSSIGLSSDLLRRTVQALESGASPPEEVEVVGTRVRVEVAHNGDEASIIRVIEDAGGTVEGTSEGTSHGLVQALIPFDQLEGIEEGESVNFIRVPLRVDIPD